MKVQSLGSSPNLPMFKREHYEVKEEVGDCSFWLNVTATF